MGGRGGGAKSEVGMAPEVPSEVIIVDEDSLGRSEVAGTRSLLDRNNGVAQVVGGGTRGEVAGKALEIESESEESEMEYFVADSPTSE